MYDMAGLWKKNVFRKSDFQDIMTVAFEDTELYVVKNYDSLLKAFYGDYMQLPPENERVGHHFYKIYRKEK